MSMPWEAWILRPGREDGFTSLEIGPYPSGDAAKRAAKNQHSMYRARGVEAYAQVLDPEGKPYQWATIGKGSAWRLRWEWGAAPGWEGSE